MSTPVDRLYEEATGILELLSQHPNEPSLQTAAAEQCRKGLLLGAASYFETRLCATVIEFVRDRAPKSILVEQLVHNKAIARQYHGWFEWKHNTATKFFALFGDQFRTLMVERVRNDDDLRASIEAFMSIGRDRNQLVHLDYASFALDKTLDQIYELYQRATLFVDSLPNVLRECDRQLRPAATEEEIQYRAFMISEERRRHGNPADPDGDWYQAQRELGE